MFSLIAQHRAEKRILSCSCGQVTLGLVCSCWCSYNVLLRVSQTMSRSELDILLILQRSNTKKQESIGTLKIGSLYLKFIQIPNNPVGKCLSRCKVKISWHIIMRKWENSHCAYSCNSFFIDPWKVRHCWSPEGKVQIYPWSAEALTQSSFKTWAVRKGLKVYKKKFIASKRKNG